ncbi:hypothetical protein SAMN02745116_02533 [Pilibacter termitis]|uniref:Uncharacterized protein n=1 Tax=Pilibacter termitis TaxID=263852 RepID=A0A1T4RCV1_9ENTE|nr:hypothetical protein [Pilibacter termitis]SKA13568.1 hypothetical protein SAMN02745116_02533 [Pilibacter termitis]
MDYFSDVMIILTTILLFIAVVGIVYYKPIDKKKGITQKEIEDISFVEKKNKFMRKEIFQMDFEVKKGSAATEPKQQ